MIVDHHKNILIVGLGLIGGSYARALKRFGFHISAIEKNPDSISYALREHMIDQGSVVVDESLVSDADIVIFALYPHVFIDWIKRNQHLFKSGALITDVTGVKKNIVYKVQGLLRADVEFIAAHPMAGKEVGGVENSSEKMFFGANYIVTPTDKNTPDAVESCKELGHLLGFSNVSVLSPEDHDEMIGFLSQLTHCIAVTLMTCNECQDLQKFTGDSFRDLTRIAKINDLMWSELFMENKEALLLQMKLFQKQFEKLKTMLEKDDVEGMREMMRASTRRRSLFDK